MFDVVVLAKGDAVAAARTLTTLIEGVVEGHVRRLVLVSQNPLEQLATLADEAGCRFEVGADPAQLGQRLGAHISTPHVLILAAGTLLSPGWTDALRADGLRHGAVQGDQAVFFMPEEQLACIKLRLRMALRLPVSLLYGALVPRAFVVQGQFDSKRVNFGRNLRLARVSAGR